ncbi:CsgG/HfaB family protein, partial [Geofilum rubicundum]|uniref:CsgG/HfaB family protein n=1 Tax=Geofilum rubicundum TaxID=472113 RepID=UPI000A0757EB
MLNYLKKSLFFCLYILTVEITYAQSSIIKGVILAIEDDAVYIDLNDSQISIGAGLQVVKKREHFVHPVTGETIQREPEVIAYVEIIEVKPNYSVGRVSPRTAINQLQPGMVAQIMDITTDASREFRKSIAIQPMNVTSARGGYLGFYIADLLTEELFSIDKFKVIDRQTLGLQMDEIAISQQGIIDEKEALRIGRTRGVDYFITGTVYEPDVVEISTGVPIKGILGTAEALSGINMGSEYVSDVRTSQLRAIVNISLRVVNVETGEILFIASEMQQSFGRSQINLEQGALGGLQLKGGATSFLNTVTGQATKAALTNLAGYIDDYFEGKIDVRHFRGNTINISGKSATKEEPKVINASITQIDYVYENDRISVSDKHTAIINKGVEEGFKNHFSYPVYTMLYESSKISGEIKEVGNKHIGTLKIKDCERNMAQGLIKFNKSFNVESELDLSNSYVENIKQRIVSVEPVLILLLDQELLGKLSIDFAVSGRFSFGYTYLASIEYRNRYLEAHGINL